MAQHDYSVANATGLAFRTDLNNALQAVVTSNSGATEPTVKFPGMMWLDMSAGGDGIIRRRNAANSAWITDAGIDQVARDAAAAAQTTANAALPLAGGTLTGMLVLPNQLPTNHQALSRFQADSLYQVRLPAAVPSGALLVTTAAGWNSYIGAGPEGSVMVVSGAYPSWQGTAQSAAVPNALVRTKSDGTIDPSLIPSVASGLRFKGTFKPTTVQQYPDASNGGSGPSGAPAVGDFWVADGLTTSGFTYLSGSLAGVTVYNGDSIALSDVTNQTWYRMGSSVNLAGYLKTDGSVAMTGPLNMGSQAITNTGAISARAGAQVNLSNFLVDNTCIVVSPYRTGPASGGSLATMQAGVHGADLGRMQLYVGTGASNQPYLPVRYFSSNEAYVNGDYVQTAAWLWRAPGSIAAGSFTASQWRYVLDTGGTQTGLPMRGSMVFGTTAELDFAQPTANTTPGWRIYPSSSGTERLIIDVCDTGGVKTLEAFNLERVGGQATFAGDVRLYGRLYGTALHNNASALTGAVNQYVGSGTYTPTISATTNVASSTAQQCQWCRVGNVVTVSGRVDIACTAAAGANTLFNLSLPIASNLSLSSNLTGGGAVGYLPRVVTSCAGDVTNDAANFGFAAQATASTALVFVFQYLVQ